MKNLYFFILCSLLMLVTQNTYSSYEVPVKLIFQNETNENIVQTQEPYLDNYSQFLKGKYQFISPPKIIAPNQKFSGELSYDWSVDWYGGSQFTYNYEGRTKDSGCFITDLRFNGYWFNTRNYNVVIASYIKDSAHANDYLTCTVENDNSKTDTFIIHLRSSSEDNKVDDGQRYSIAGDTTYLTYSSTYGIDLPIALNPKLTLYPNQAQPELIRKDYTPPTASPYYTSTVQVINHTNLTLIAGTPILDRQTRFNSSYIVEQPPIIAPKETKAITLSSSAYAYEPSRLARFNYHIKGYAADSGCYISHLLTHDIASFYFDSQHPEPDANLYCIMTNENTVEIYDYLVPELFESCTSKTTMKASDCISRKGHFVKNLSKDVCYHGYDFNIDPIHKVTATHVDCNIE